MTKPRSRPLRTDAPAQPRTQGERIRFARINSGLTQDRLAALVKRHGGTIVSKSLVSQWERDTVRNPNNDNLFALEMATGFSARWISTGKGDSRSLAFSEGIEIDVLARAIRLADGDAHRAAKLYEVLKSTPSLTDEMVAALAAALG